MTTPAGYTRRQIALHWAVAILIAGQYLLEDGISAAWRAFRNGAPGAFDPLVLAHVAGGVLILILVAWRLALRLRHGAPPPPEDEHPALKAVAKLAHMALYVLLVGLPVTGLAAWFGGIAPAAEIHEILTNVLLVLVALHVLAALLHHFIQKTEVMRRMIRPAG